MIRRFLCHWFGLHEEAHRRVSATHSILTCKHCQWVASLDHVNKTITTIEDEDGNPA